MSKEEDYEPQPQSSSSQIQAVQEQERNFNRPLRWFKLFCGTASAAGFAVGLRAAWVQAKPLKPGEIPRTLLLSSSGFAMQAFGIATLITVSGYVALLVIVSELMGVNTFKEFGRRTTNMFGDRFRISRGGGAGENYTSLTELFEALQQQQQKKDGESKDER